MENIRTAFITGCLEIGILYIVLYIAKMTGADLRVLSISSVITQMVAVMLLPTICLLIFRKDTGSFFRIRRTYLLLLLCIMYYAFFAVHQQFNMPDFYLFIQNLIIIGFSEEYLYRGMMYFIMKKENITLVIVLSSLFRGITHAVYPTVMVGGGLSIFLTDCISNVGFGLFIGYGFIYVFEESKTLWIPILLHAVYDYSMGYGWIVFVGTVMYLYIVNKGGHARQK